MKKLMLVIGVAAMLATVSHAQTNADNSQIKSSAIAFAQNVESNRTISVASYPSYAPDIVVNGKKDTFGLGLALLTPATVIPALQDSTVAQHAFAGLRFDYLAHEAFASTVGVGFRGDVQLWGHNFDGFVHGGANIPFSGFGVHNGDIGGMVGSGGYTSLLSFGKTLPNCQRAGSLGLQVSLEKWTQFKGIVWHGGPVANWSW